MTVFPPMVVVDLTALVKSGASLHPASVPVITEHEVQKNDNNLIN